MKTVRFGDAVRERPEAPDIRTVAVSNTEASSSSSTAITFRIEIARRPSARRIAVWIDADDDQTTGLGEAGASPGADHVVNWDLEQRREPSLLRCGRSRCRTASAPSFRFSQSSGPTFTIDAADLGDTRRFRFSARAYSAAGVDFAPAEGDAWRYQVLFRRPAAPRGSRSFTVRFTVTREDGSLLTDGRVSCTARVAGKRVAPRFAGFVGRRATCVFVLPLSAAGKTIRGTITVVSGPTRVTKPFQRTLR